MSNLLNEAPGGLSCPQVHSACSGELDSMEDAGSPADDDRWLSTAASMGRKLETECAT